MSKKKSKPKIPYTVRRVHIGTSQQLQELSHECGELYSKTLVFFWRTVRHKGIWLKPRLLMRLFTSPKLHAHTSDACVQAFFAALASWRELRQTDPNAKPPHRRRWYFRIEYKRSALSLTAGMLRLSNGRGNAPLVLPWSWDLPQTVVIRWTGSEYEALATYAIGAPIMPEEEEEEPDYQARRAEQSAGIDLGEVHAAVSHDGHHTHIMNGRLLRSKRQYQNKLKAELDGRIARKKQGSKRRKKLIRTKQKQLRKMKNQIKDVEHKLTSKLICTLQREGVQRLVIGDVRSIRKGLDVGSTNNQKLHQWSFGSVRHKLTYKAERAGMRVLLQEERDTSRTCPVCVTPVKGHHFSGEQSSTSSGIGSMPNVSLAPERAVKDQSMTLRRESDGSSKPECLSGQSRHGESYTALILEPSGISGVWWEAGDTHYLLNTFFPTLGRYTQSGDAVPIREQRFERETYIESI